MFLELFTCIDMIRLAQCLTPDSKLVSVRLMQRPAAEHSQHIQCKEIAKRMPPFRYNKRNFNKRKKKMQIQLVHLMSDLETLETTYNF